MDTDDIHPSSSYVTSHNDLYKAFLDLKNSTTPSWKSKVSFNNNNATRSNNTEGEGAYVQAIREARDNWSTRAVIVNDDSDSSAIISAIDVDMLDVSSEYFVQEIYIVLDTNILLNHLSVVKGVVTCIEAEKGRLPIVILIPGIVISELDFQKNSTRQIASAAREASKWLAKHIGSGRGRVKGQAYSQTKLPSGDWRQRVGLSNDGLILDCCKYFNQIKQKDVLLCTGDNNLAVSASTNANSGLFLRGEAAVIRPTRKLFTAEQLLQSAIPGYEVPPSVRATMGRRDQDIGDNEMGSEPAVQVMSHAAMEIDMDDVENPPTTVGQHRDELHRRLVEELRMHVRNITGKAAGLQRYRREHESQYSPMNRRYAGTLPTEADWRMDWSVRDCLKFLVKIPPSKPKASWIFGDGDATSLADFVAISGERGARKGREWAKNDWTRNVTTIAELAGAFEYEGLYTGRLAEYEYSIMEVFALDLDNEEFA
ncbi:hypothetical protein M422DRAFT_238313 [Sphaerobolus stellatus SS14]|nr:hypothetical protein M422DRAFT_238313 [Sphaerobolus stellatus SS14]